MTGSPEGRRPDVAARMFAPSIGVPEDVANANSTGCLAAHLAGQGAIELTAEMGESLHRMHEFRGFPTGGSR